MMSFVVKLSRSEALIARRRFMEDYLAKFGADPDRMRVLHRLLACRTEVMGTHPCVCESCGWRGLAFNMTESPQYG